MPKDHPVRETPAPRSGVEPALDRVAGWSFLLLVAALPWSIAPMSIAAGICAALTLAVWARTPPAGPRRRSPGPRSRGLIALALSAWFALDRAASLPRLSKAFFPLLVPLAATHARLPHRGRRALAVLLVSATLAALFGLALYVAKGAAWPARAHGAVGHYMTFGGQLLLFVSLAAGVLALERAPRWRAGRARARRSPVASRSPPPTRAAPGSGWPSRWRPCSAWRARAGSRRWPPRW